MRSTNKAPETLSNSYFTGSPPTGTSMMTLMFSGGLSPVGMRLMFMTAHLKGQIAGCSDSAQPYRQGTQRRFVRGASGQTLPGRQHEAPRQLIHRPSRLRYGPAAWTQQMPPHQ